MTANEFAMFYLTRYDSPLGETLLAADEEFLRGVWFCGQRYEGFGLVEAECVWRETSILTLTRQWLDEYFSGSVPDFTPPYRIEGSEFRRRVISAIASIPRGQTRSYGELARDVAWVMGREIVSARAVGGAVGRNPISIIVPCHRVVGSNGNLTGYAGGLERKIRLWTWEGIDLDASGLFLPKWRED